MRDRLGMVAVALASMGIRLIPIDAEEARNQLVHGPVGRRNTMTRNPDQVSIGRVKTHNEYIHIAEPVSKRRARRLRGKAKA